MRNKGVSWSRPQCDIHDNTGCALVTRTFTRFVDEHTHPLVARSCLPPTLGHPADATTDLGNGQVLPSQSLDLIVKRLIEVRGGSHARDGDRSRQTHL